MWRSASDRSRGSGARCSSMAGRRRKRVYHRDAHGRFAPASGGSTEDERRKKRRRTAAGVTVAVGAVAATQAHPASRTRTTVQRRRIVKGHVARARADHARNVSRRNPGLSDCGAHVQAVQREGRESRGPHADQGLPKERQNGCGKRLESLDESN